MVADQAKDGKGDGWITRFIWVESRMDGRGVRRHGPESGGLGACGAEMT